MILRKIFLCWWGGCGMTQREDATHVWGECLRCGKIAGQISREQIRRYIDACEREREQSAKFWDEYAAARGMRERRHVRWKHILGDDT